MTNDLEQVGALMQRLEDFRLAHAEESPKVAVTHDNRGWRVYVLLGLRDHHRYSYSGSGPTLRSAVSEFLHNVARDRRYQKFTDVVSHFQEEE